MLQKLDLRFEIYCSSNHRLYFPLQVGIHLRQSVKLRLEEIQLILQPLHMLVFLELLVFFGEFMFELIDVFVYFVHVALVSS